MDQLARGVDITKQNVVDGMTRRLTKRATVEYTGDVVVGSPLIEKTRSNGVDDNNGVVAVVGDIVYETNEC
jgi:hypothetical protein